MWAATEQQRINLQWEQTVTGAWLTAAMTRAKRPPSLASLLGKGNKQRPLTDEERARAQATREREGDRTEALRAFVERKGQVLER